MRKRIKGAVSSDPTFSKAHEAQRKSEWKISEESDNKREHKSLENRR